MNRRILPALIAAALLYSVPAMADTLDERIDAAKVEAKATKKQLKEDQKDFKAIGKLRAKWEKAREKGSRDGMIKADTSIADWTRANLAEGRDKMEDAEAEVEAGGGTVPAEGSKPPVHGPGAPPKKKPPVRGGGASPGPGVPDDLEDLHAARVRQERLRELAEDLKALQPKFNNGTASAAEYDKKSTMLKELHKLAGRDVARSEAELAEDKADLDRLKAKK